MASTIPTLWPEEAIQVDALTPVAILKTQRVELEKITQGTLRAELTERDLENDTVEIEFSILAPALNYRHPLLKVRYQKNVPYPVQIDAPRVVLGPAYSQESFLAALKTVLGSESAIATLQSLIARSNEVQQKRVAAEKD
jgi:mannose-6-phosphate isomerase class I